MSTGNFGMFPVSLFVFIFLCHLGILHSAEEGMRYHPSCPPFPCGKLGLIKFPFATLNQPRHCGLLIVDGCENDSDAQKIQLVKGGTWYPVQNISQANEFFIHDELLSKHLRTRNCSTFESLTFPWLPYLSFEIGPKLDLLKCNHNLTAASQLEFNYSGCTNTSIFYGREPRNLSYVPPQCLLVQLPHYREGNHSDIFQMITADFPLTVNVSGSCMRCHNREGECQVNSKQHFQCSMKEGKGKRILVEAAVAGTVVLFFTVGCCFRFRRRCLSINLCFSKKTQDDRRIESFLMNHGSLAPKRYRYSQVKRMTMGFKEKLGQGGYGSVFKGELVDDGRLVAVKVLNLEGSKSNAEQFINEVASISRTSHVNVVTLIGFCFEGSKRALIYEFMSKGSLDKYINGGNPNPQLGWETLHQIAVGIAQGLEYLHRGCNTRILHFDIKPHNILLDETFCPKISDFGLAKICPRKESMVSLLCARGTAGYIAPEVFCRSIGKVSHKSDVYSYGMMVLDMVGARNNVCAPQVDHNSEVYFPDWIFDRLKEGKQLGLGDEENQIARKMVLVSLWCIQTEPSNRPPMCTVVEMLQTHLDSLPIPPRPCFSSSPARFDFTNSSTMVTTNLSQEKPSVSSSK